jgi:ribosomal protein S18 acetylase RimI-like enzyme
MTITDYEIKEPTVEEAERIGQLQLRSWLNTYQNPALGVDETWIRREAGFLAEPRGPKMREAFIASVEANSDHTFYRIAKKNDDVIAVCLAMKPNRAAKPTYLDSLHVDTPNQGRHIGTSLMEKMISWSGNDRPIRLEVVSYNQRAIDFYKKFDFVLTGREYNRKPPIVSLEMLRP